MCKYLSGRGFISSRAGNRLNVALKLPGPSIETATIGWLGEGVFVCMWMARRGQERIVAKRLKETLESAIV